MAFDLLSATELLAQLESKSVSSLELVDFFFDRIESLDDKIKSFISTDRTLATEQAKSIDAKRAAGKSLGKLAGIPIAIKDLICTTDSKTTCASRMLENFQAPYDATVITKLKHADAIVVGKTNLDEFAMGSSTENSAFFETRNPWDLERIPGGSSGGSAASVAAGMVPLSLGTDTGGSIRQPAALCGIVGLKPTYGRVSRFGQIAFASSLDQIGPMTHCVSDAALLLEVIAGYDPSDSTCSQEPVEEFTMSLDQPIAGLKIGIAEQFFGDGLDEEVRSAIDESIETFRSLGASVETISLEQAELGIATYYVIAPCEASSNLSRYDGIHYGFRAAETEFGEGGPSLNELYEKSRSLGFGEEVKRRIMLGTYALSAGYYDAYFLKAAKVRRLIRAEYLKAFKSVDLILGPTTPTPAFKLGEKKSDPLSMYLGDVYTVSANLAGIPAISIPCGFSKTQLPIGLQLQAAPFQETKLLQAAFRFQNETQWNQKRAEL